MKLQIKWLKKKTPPFLPLFFYSPLPFPFFLLAFSTTLSFLFLPLPFFYPLLFSHLYSPFKSYKSPLGEMFCMEDKRICLGYLYDFSPLIFYLFFNWKICLKPFFTIVACGGWFSHVWAIIKVRKKWRKMGSKQGRS